MTLNETFDTPRTLVAILEHRPSNRAELLTYAANWKVYADFLLAQAKATQNMPNHPLHTEEGQAKFVAEITRVQETYSKVEADLRGRHLNLHADEMRKIGGIFTEANLVIEQAIAIHQMA